MQLVIDTFKNTGSIHHAYCIEGRREEVLPLLHQFLEKDFDFTVTGNPDLWSKTCDTLTIDDGRKIKEFHVCKSFDKSGKKVFIVAANFITREAQNALLKIFEEPHPGNYFFIITPSADILLPTLRSRLAIIPSNQETTTGVLAKQFVNATVAERLVIAKEIAESIQDEEKSKADAIRFINQIERTVVTRKDIEKMSVSELAVLRELSKVRDYLGDRAPSVKLILEHIALIL